VFSARDVELRKTGKGAWEAGYRCPILDHWTWLSFAARTKAQAEKLGLSKLAQLMRESADRAESRIKTMSELAKAITHRALRTEERKP